MRDKNGEVAVRSSPSMQIVYTLVVSKYAQRVRVEMGGTGCPPMQAAAPRRPMCTENGRERCRAVLKMEKETRDGLHGSCRDGLGVE
jgi:hypothetical protein